MAKIRKSEYRSYAWMKTELQKAGWNTKNPALDAGGEVYYQQECLNHPEIRKVLGRQRPKFVIKLNGTEYWVIEAKGEVSEIGKVFDPTCGTGGFLVAAFDYVREHASPEQTQIFKEHRIFGIEQDPTVATMAIINMIFRGDGKSNIINDDCFPEHLKSKTENGIETGEYVLFQEGMENNGPVTKVLMNPPFSKNNENEREYMFIQHALGQMQPGGILFSIIPTSVLIKGGKPKNWRKQLLAENTLLSVIDFPEDLFYPVGIRTVGIFIKKGIPHDAKKDRVLWAKVWQDGFVKSKGKRLSDHRIPDELKELKKYLKIHLYDTSILRRNIPEKMRICLWNEKDENIELMPEVYLEEAAETKQQLMDQVEQYVREYLSFLIKRGVKMNIKGKQEEERYRLPEQMQYGEFMLSDFLREPCYSGSVHSVSEVGEGQIPLISCKTENNGIVGHCDVDLEECTYHCLTIAGDGSFPLTSYYHFEPVASYDNVTIAPLEDDLSLEIIFFLASRLNRSRWRYSYGRKCYAKKARELKVRIPVNEKGEPDEGMIKSMFSQMYGWREIVSYITAQRDHVEK